MSISTYHSERRFCGSKHSMEMKLFYGACISRDSTPVVGRLQFEEQETASCSTQSYLCVTNDQAKIEIDRDGVAAWVVIGEQTPISPSVPVLYLSELSNDCHGKIALLDPTRGLLFVSPDLATLDQYKERLRVLSPKENLAPLFLQSGKQSRLSSRSAIDTEGAEGALLMLSGSLSEEELYNQCRDIAESAPGLPFTTVLDLSQSEDMLHTQLRALFRSAVYGNFSCMAKGCLTDSDRRRFLACAHRCFCELESEGREFNGYIAKGLLINTPFLLTSSIHTDGLDFLCVDLCELITKMIGTTMRTDEELLDGLGKILAEGLTQEFSLPLSMIADGTPTVKALLPRLISGSVSVEELFLPTEMLSGLRHKRSFL